MSKRAKRLYEFGPFFLDATERLLLRNGEPVLMTPKAFDTLLTLVENSGRLVDKDELMERVWPDVVVEESTLAQNISTLRKALGETPSEKRYIETVPKHGYRFVPSVREVGDGNGDLIAEKRGRSNILIERQSEASPPSQDALLDSVSTEKASAPGSEARRESKRVSLAVLTVSAALIIAITTTILLKTRGGKEAQTVPVIRSIAVLPLADLSGDASQEYFADGVTESLINNLAQIRALRVISRTSVMRYKQSRASLPEIARELNVDAVITGSMRRAGGRVRLTAQLIHAATDAHVWARDYERDLTDLLKLEREMARAVADEIRIQLRAEERARLAWGRRLNPEAHEACLLGRHHFNKDTEEGFRRAIECFERAIEIEPGYAAAYVGLANATIFLGLVGAEPIMQIEGPARAAALKAIELDNQLADAYLSLARIKQHYDWDWVAAETEIRRALELDPGGVDVHKDYGYLLMHLGRLDGAIREGEIAVQLDPVSSLTRSALGRFFYRAHRYDEALVHLQRAVELEPRSAHANYRLADLHAQRGKYAEAIAGYERAREVSPKGGNPQAAIARVYALMGRHREARQMIHGLRAAPHVLASVYAALDEKDEALRILERSVAAREFATPLKAEPPLESLYSDPRYQALLHHMNLPTQ